MPTVSSSHGFYLPLLTDPNPKVEDLNMWALQADTYCIPRFATKAERDVAFSGFTDYPRLCYVEETGEWYKCAPGSGGLSWLSWIPRKFVVKQPVTTTGNDEAGVTPFLTFPVEANSTYTLRGFINFTIPGQWLYVTLRPTSSTITGYIVVAFNDTTLFGLGSLGARVESGTVNERIETIKYCQFSTTDATNVNFVFTKSSGSVGTIHPYGTYIEVWKTAGG
jgi:hypothetical protein